jgi:anti-sigma-K factor RskA
MNLTIRSLVAVAVATVVLVLAVAFAVRRSTPTRADVQAVQQQLTDLQLAMKREQERGTNVLQRLERLQGEIAHRPQPATASR